MEFIQLGELVINLSQVAQVKFELEDHKITYALVTYSGGYRYDVFNEDAQILYNKLSQED